MKLDLEIARKSLNDTAAAIHELRDSDLERIAIEIQACQNSGSFIWTAGNGGSASTASHLACDLGKGVSSTCGTPVRTISITEQMATQSAWGNDFGFENAIKNQLQMLAKPGDLLLCISGSGNSENIVRAAKYAKESGLRVISLLGKNGGKISEFSNLELRVNSTDMQVLENVHLSIVHWLFKAMSYGC